MRREYNQVCFLGECDHEFRTPTANEVASSHRDASTFYAAQLQAVSSISKGQEKALEMAPELSEIYREQLKRREEKFGLDWDMSGKD